MDRGPWQSMGFQRAGHDWAANTFTFKGACLRSIIIISSVQVILFEQCDSVVHQVGNRNPIILGCGEVENSGEWAIDWKNELCICVCMLFTKSCLSLCDPMNCPTRLLCPWDFQGKNTRVGSHSLLQGIFPTQGLNPGFLHCRQILYQLSYKVSPPL